VLRSTSIVCALSIALMSSVARGDVESWTWVEHRSPLLRSNPRSTRVMLRGFYDVRFTGRQQGLGLVFARIGPVVEVLPWLSVAASYAAFTSRTPPWGPWVWEQRVEVEATASLRTGALVLSHRQRYESRWRERWHHFRVRFQGRATVIPARSMVGVYLWEEALIDPNATDASGAPAPGFFENRAGVGLTFVLSPAVKIDLGYALRLRQPAQWELDHVIHTSFAFSLRD
jgi:hypothetical protein